MSVHLGSVLRQAAPELHGREYAGFEGSVAGLLHRLCADAGPAFGERVFQDGRLRRYLNVYVDGTDIRFLGGLDTPLARAARVELIPAVAGG